MQNSGPTIDRSRGVIAEAAAAPPCLDAQDLHGGVRDERMERADGIRATTDARNDHLG